MDALDIRILRAMGVGPFGPEPRGPGALSPARIARSVGRSAEAVRERIRRMERTGLIAGYQANPNLRHFGLETTSYLFRLPDGGDAQEAMQRLEPVEGLLASHVFLGGELCIDFCHRGPAHLARQVRLLSTLVQDPEPARFYGWDLPPAGREPTALDWRILQAVRHDAMRPLPEVAAELGVPYRTVKRRHDALAREGSLYAAPVLNPGQEPGLIPFWLLFFLKPSAPAGTPQRILETFDDLQVHAQRAPGDGQGNLGLILFAGSPAEVERLRRKGAAVPGVARAEAKVAVEAAEHGAWIDDEIARRATDARRAAAGPQAVAGTRSAAGKPAVAGKQAVAGTPAAAPAE